VTLIPGSARSEDVHTLSVVVPVYQGQRTLPALVKEIAHLTSVSTTDGGHDFRITEVVLVYDHGPDDSAETIRQLAREYSFVRPVWLSRNFGQHAATLAGMASAGGDWIVTMDEDGQHSPADIPYFLDTALREQATVVYAEPTNVAPHGWFRNSASKATKWVFSRLLSNGGSTSFQSFRLVLGEVGRSVAAYAGPGVFLDVAMMWVTDRTASVPVALRSEGDRQSGYSLGRLLSHFWHMVLTSGTRPLRFVSFLGATMASVGFLTAIVVVVARITSGVSVQGWASVMAAILLGFGAMLFALGIIAEYVGVSVNMAMGKPLYLVMTDPAQGPLGRDRRASQNE
jgi:polyisoprenyl-phosphate glycosyltransferase